MLHVQQAIGRSIPGKENTLTAKKNLTGLIMGDTGVRTPLRDVNRKQGLGASVKKSSALLNLKKDATLSTPSARNKKLARASKQKPSIYNDENTSTPKLPLRLSEKKGETGKRIFVPQSEDCSTSEKQSKDESFEIQSLVYGKVVGIVEKLQNDMDIMLQTRDEEIVRLQEQIKCLQASPSAEIKHNTFEVLNHQNNEDEADIESYVNDILQRAVTQLTTESRATRPSTKSSEKKKVHFSAQSPAIINISHTSNEIDASFEVLNTSGSEGGDQFSAQQQISYTFQARLNSGFSPSLQNRLSTHSPLNVQVSTSPSLVPINDALSCVSKLSENNEHCIRTFRECIERGNAFAFDALESDNHCTPSENVPGLYTVDVMTSPMACVGRSAYSVEDFGSQTMKSPVQLISMGTAMSPLQCNGIGSGSHLSVPGLCNGTATKGQMTSPAVLSTHQTMTSPIIMANQDTMVTPVRHVSFGQVTTPVGVSSRHMMTSPIKTVHRGVCAVSESRTQGTNTNKTLTKNFGQNVNLFHKEAVVRHLRPVMTISRGVMTTTPSVADASQFTTPMKTHSVGQCMTPISMVDMATVMSSPTQCEQSMMTSPARTCEANTVTTPGLGFDHPVTMRQQISNFHANVLRLEREVTMKQRSLEEQEGEIELLTSELSSYKEMCSKQRDVIETQQEKIDSARHLKEDLRDTQDRLEACESQAKEHMDFMEQERTTLIESLHETDDKLNSTTLELSRYKVAFYEKARMCQNYEKSFKEFSENQQVLQTELDGTKAHAHFMLLSQGTEIQESGEEASQLLTTMSDFLQKLRCREEQVTSSSSKQEIEPPQFTSTHQGASLVSCILDAVHNTNEIHSSQELTPPSPIRADEQEEAINQPSPTNQFVVSKTSAFSEVTPDPVVKDEPREDNSLAADQTLVDIIKELKLTMSGIIETVECINNERSTTEKSLTRTTNELKDQNLYLGRQVNECKQHEQHLQQELANNRAKLEKCKDDLVYSTNMLKQQTDNFSRFSDQQDEIRRLTSEVDRLSKCCCDYESEVKMLSNELKTVLQKMDTPGNEQSSFEHKIEMMSVKRENQKLREKLLERKDYLEKAIATANRRMTAYEGNWRIAEKEVYELDELVEKIRQALLRNKEVVEKSSDLGDLLLELDGCKTQSPARKGKESHV